MAKAIPTTPRAATEVLPHQDSFPHTAISSMFSDLLDALARHVETERDLQDVDIWDVAYRAWLSDAENAFTDVATLLSAIRRERPVRAEDLLLLRAAHLIDAMIGSEEPGMFQQLYDPLPRLDGQLCRPGHDPVARPVMQMLRTARGLIEDLAGLPLYAGADENDGDGPHVEPCGQLAA